MLFAFFIVSNNKQGCSVHRYGCKTSPLCTFAVKSSVCSEQCDQLGPAQLCKCPADYYGKNCESKKPIVLSLELVSPKYYQASLDSVRINVSSKVKKIIFFFIHENVESFSDINFYRRP